MVANASTATSFSAGDVVVYRVGDGNASLSDNAAPVFLDEYTRTGTLVRSTALPTSDSGSTHDAVYNRASGMPNYNNEGFSVAGADECVSGAEPVYWSDDSNDGGHAIRKGSITC